MQNFFNLCEHSQIRSDAYDYLLSLCDRASYLYGYRTDDKFDFESEAIGTDLESLIVDITHKETAESWGMMGTQYYFSMSKRTKAIINKYGLGGIISVNNKTLENLSLYNNGKLLYSVCSHEGYESFDEEFKNKVSKYCIKKATELPVYKELDKKFTQYSSAPKEELNKCFKILNDILGYVQQACRAVIYGLPAYEITYEEYVGLVEKYLSDSCAKKLKAYKRFDELHPAGYPKTFAEIEKFTNVPGFQCSKIFIEIMEQLDILKVVWYNRGVDPFDGREQTTPTIVIADK